MKRVFPVQVSSGSAQAACEVLTQPPNLRARRLLCQWTTGLTSVIREDCSHWRYLPLLGEFFHTGPKPLQPERMALPERCAC